MNQETDVKSPWAELDTDAEPTLSPATLDIYNGILAANDKARSNNINRGSNASKCERSLWYAAQGYKAKEMAPRAYNNFSLGHVAEAVLKAQIKKYCVGETKLYKSVIFGDVISSTQIGDVEIEVHKQLESSFKYYANAQEQEVLCHFDGLGELQDGSWELIEIKSSSSYGFSKFKSEGPGDYLHQAHAYMMTDMCARKAVKQVRFFYVRKDTGHITDRVFPYDLDTCDLVLNKYIAGLGKEKPDRPYVAEPETYYKKPTGRSKLVWQCSYCPYTTHCWGDVKLEYKKDQFQNHKPTYYVEAT